MQTILTHTSDGAKIAYDIQGKGPPLVLLHGAGNTRTDWHKAGYVERLTEQFTVLTIDLRGCGDSTPTIQISDFAIEQLLTDVQVVLDACGLDTFALWGYSLGGRVPRIC